MDTMLDSIIKMSSALLTPVIAVISAIILINQYRLQKLRWRLDLYDKRYRVFLNTMEFLSFVVARHNVDDDSLTKFLRGSKDKEFLFGDDIKDYLDELYSKGLDLQLIETELKDTPVREEWNAKVKKSSQLFQWFTKQFEVSKRLFREYLAISAK
jgi:hypothetical protein